MSDRDGPKGRVLIIAGSDSGGGAGIQADIKAVAMLGGHAMTAVTAITVQDTKGVHGVWPVPLEAVLGQIKVTLADIGADTIKTGMLGSAQLVEAIAEAQFFHTQVIVERLHLRGERFPFRLTAIERVAEVAG